MIELIKVVEFLGVKGDFPFKEMDCVQAITDSSFGDKSLGWCSDKNRDLLIGLKGGNVLVSHDTFEAIAGNISSIVLLPVENPRLAFSNVLKEFFAPKICYGIVHTNSIVSSDAVFDSSQVNIGPNVVLESGVKLGERVVIGANTVIKANTIIGDDCSVGCNCTIGGVGFGYEMNELGQYELMPHVGNVVLENGVDVGNNVCIDRAVMGSTILRNNVKVDNLVHIAHGVEIGANSLVIAHAMVAGSVKVGENVWISPSSSIRQKLVIEDNALVGMGSVVVKNVNKGTVVAGNPAKVFGKK